MVITEFINPKTTVLEEEFGFDEAFKSISFIGIKPRASKNINKKNKSSEYLKIKEGELTDMVSTPSIINEINNANYKRYMKENLEIRSKNIYIPCQYNL